MTALQVENCLGEIPRASREYTPQLVAAARAFRATYGWNPLDIRTNANYQFALANRGNAGVAARGALLHQANRLCSESRARYIGAERCWELRQAGHLAMLAWYWSGLRFNY